MENWRDIPGYEGLYRVSDQGRVFSVRNGITLKQQNTKGYAAVALCQSGAKLVKVHRLVAMAFIPNPEGKPTVNHINENKMDNRVCNLEWATNAEQNVHGTRIMRAATSKRREVFQYSLDGEFICKWPSITDASVQLGIGKGNIWSALEGRYKQAGGFIWRRSLIA